MLFHSTFLTEHTVKTIVKGYKLLHCSLRWIFSLYPCNSYYNFFEETLNENQLCAGIPSNSKYTIPFSGKHQEDFGGPLICLDKTTKNPIFTGIASSNSLSTKRGQPARIHIDFNQAHLEFFSLTFQNWCFFKSHLNPK